MRYLPFALVLMFADPAFAAVQKVDCAVSSENASCALALLETSSARGDLAAKVQLATELLKEPSPSNAQRAVRLLTAVAATGDAWAAATLAGLYREGKVVPQDGRKVLALLEGPAKAGSPPALVGLGELYLNGARGVPRDIATAAHYFERAGATGDLWGKYQLALILLSGEGVPMNVERAVALLGRVSQGGDPWVLITLGDIYASGRALPAEAALPYFEQAAGTGSTAAMTRLAQAYASGLGALAPDAERARSYWEKAAALGDSFAAINLAQQLLGEGNSAASRRAVELLDRAASRGDAWPATILADLLIRGEKVPADAGRAERLLKPLAEKGNTAGEIALGDLYLKGADTVPANPAKAFDLFEAALKGGDDNAVSRLGFMLVRGEGTGKDVARGEDLLAEAVAKSSDPWLAINVGALYADGRALPANGGKAVAMFKRAADLGGTAGLFRLGLAYRDGVGEIAPDADMARLYLGKAAAMGDNGSRVTLAQMLLGSKEPADADAAMALLESAAADHDIWGTTSLAAVLLRGEPFPADGARAHDLLAPLAESGNASAMTLLGDLYVQGAAPFKQDLPKGQDYYEKAAALGDMGAKNKLGLMLLDGRAGATEPERGVGLLREVADAGDGWAMIQLGDALTAGGAVPVDALAARDYYQKAFDGGISAGAIKLGLLYLDGKGALPPDAGKAAQFFEKAVSAGEDVGRIYLAQMLADGRGVKKDQGRALELLSEAAGNGSAWASGILGAYYADGRNGDPDFDKAKAHFAAAKAAGDEAASMRFGMLLATGPLAKEHGSEGVRLVRAALEAGVPGAAVEMARLEMMGLAGEGGPKAAERRLLSAVEKNDASALRLLLQLYRSGARDMAPSLKSASTLLAQRHGLLSPDAYAFETLALQAAARPTPNSLRAVGSEFAKLGNSDVSQAVQMLFWSNQNAYVYVLQQQLKLAKRYGGPVDGRLTRGTIRALGQTCRAEISEKRLCEIGPLTADFAVVISRHIASTFTGSAVH